MNRARLALAANIALTLLLAGGSPARACACGSASRAKAIASQAVVVKGRVVKIVQQGNPDAAGSTTILLRILVPIKGRTAREVMFTTPAASFACGLTLHPGDVVTLGLGMQDGQYWANACTLIL